MEVSKKMVFFVLAFLLLFCLVPFVYGGTDPGDLAIINQFRDGLKNPELLKWPTNDDPCGPPSWPYIFCSGSRVQQIQAKGLGLKGTLPQNLNQLSELTDLGLQQNELTGKLPSLSGLSQLRRVYLDFNQFDTIPSDFFNGLQSLEVMALDYIPLNATAGWSLPDDLQNSAQLTNLTLVDCNLAGPLPEFLGNMSSLQVLLLSKNRITGGIPATFKDSMLRMLWLNDQSGEGMTGPIDVIAEMVSLTTLWLHGNRFSGKIPKDIGNLVELHDLNLNGNNLVGLIPDSLASLPLQKLDLNNNQFMGPMPEFKGVINATYSSNPFCQKTPGAPCAPEVMALLDFLDGVNYPTRLVQGWSGNDPCKGSWFGVGCNLDKNKVVTINLPRFNLTGTLSPSVANLDSLSRIYLGSNHLSGEIPMSWTGLKSLVLLDLSNNNLSPPKPTNFSSSVHITVDGNPLFSFSPPSQKNNTSGDSPPSPTKGSGSPGAGSPGAGSDNSPSDNRIKGEGKSSNKVKLAVIVAPAASFAFLVLLVLPLSFYLCKKRKNRTPVPSSIVIHPRDSSDPDNLVKIVVANNNTTTQGSVSSLTGSGAASRNSSESHVIESGNLVISVEVLRNVTKNFAPENELGRGGFGVVYKGELDDGTKIAVKRMEAGILSSKALNEFQSEIAVLSKVRHRHLVSLLGYSTEGNERILVYEFMPQGALSRHLFHWKTFKLEPLSWKRRLNIALDVARGMEYLHTLAHQSFIHRDLKSSNILLGDDFRAKVSDFGLVKLAPDGDQKSVVTRLAGTFGYLAPEYAGNLHLLF